MTKDKILSAEEFLWKVIMTQTGTPETDMASIEDMSKIPEFSRTVGMLNDYAAQFHPPTMTDDETQEDINILLEAFFEHYTPVYKKEASFIIKELLNHFSITRK